MKHASQEIRVGLVQIGENFGGQYYLPYSVGLLHAYAKRHLTSYNDYHFLLPLYKRMSMEEIVLYFNEVKIIFFSAYMWNFNFSLEIAKKISLTNPDCCIVFGGPQIPDTSKALECFLRKYPFIDIGCYGEGEVPFVQILQNFQEKAWLKVSSIGYLTPDNSFIRNDSAGRISDINQIPSPYLSGIFEPLMKANSEESWAALWESNRGCPFSCSYCAWGKDSKKTIYKYDMGRLFGELDWFSDNKIEFIFCCDANFGLFKKRDMEIVAKVVENKKRGGYPKAFSVQSTKNATQTIFELQKELNSAGLQKGVNLALQSVNQQTLRSVNRSNISAEKFQELQTMFMDAGIATFSDMILGLPEESYDTFTSGVSSVIDGGQHNRIQFINLAILENTEMANHKYLEKFGMIVQACKMVSHHTRISIGNEITETQMLVVGTRAMPKKEWVKTQAFCWMTSLLHFNKLFQIPLIILRKAYSLSYKQLVEWFLICDKQYPIISEIAMFFNEKALSIQSGGTEYVPSREWLDIYWPADEFVFIKLCSENILLEFYEEAKRIIIQNFQKSNITISEDLLNNAITSNYKLIKQPFVKENKNLDLGYNILEYYQAVLAGKCVPLTDGSFSYEILCSQDTWDSWSEWCKEVVWYGTKRGAYLYSYNKN